MPNQQKKVLIITYYWPPGGGAGVQRWLKFVKYLGQFGWEPIVYTPENSEIPVQDDSLAGDIPADLTIIKKDIWEPYSAYKRFLGAKKEEKLNIGGFLSEEKNYGIKDKISAFIRGNLFIPDARKFWIKPSVRFLRDHLKKQVVDLVVTTGPPHSMHLIGLKLKKNTDLPWIADFRDPWTRIYFYKDFGLTKWADRIHKKLEKKVLQSADHILTVGRTLKKEFEELGAKEVSVITNGYDDSDFENVKPAELPGFTITHTGNISRSKNTPVLWKALFELTNENEDFRNDLKIRLAGKLDYSVNEAVKSFQLEGNVLKLGYINHDEVAKELMSATILIILTSNTPHSKGAIPGRTFEYLAAKRPIIAIAHPQSDLAEVLKKTGAGKIVDYDDKKRLKDTIWRYYQQYREGRLKMESNDYAYFSRKYLTEQLAGLFNSVTNP